MRSRDASRSSPAAPVGVGRAMGERFAHDGMKVVLADVEPPALDATVAELRADGLDVIGR